jgi:hypothetical protein
MTYQATILADNPVAYYPLDETSGTAAADASTNANNGTYTSGFTLNQAGAGTLTGRAVTFASGYVTVPSIAAINITGDITLECWVYPTTRGNYYWLVAKTSGNGGTTSAYEWRLETTTGIPKFLCASGGAVSAAAAPNLNEWSHLAVTVSGTTVTHYLNGATNGSGTLGGSRATTSTALKIGTRDDTFTTFVGRLDEVAIYATVLTQSQFQAHIAAAGNPAARASQVVLEVLATGTPQARASQIVVEALTSTTLLTQRKGGQGYVVG